MKIAFIVNEFPKLSETFILNQITGLLDRGHDVRVFSTFAGDEDRVHSEVARYDLLDRVSYSGMPRNLLTRMTTAIPIGVRHAVEEPTTVIESLNYSKYSRRALSLQLLYSSFNFPDEKFDIIHSHFGPKGIVGAFLKSVGYQAKLVTMFHGNDVQLGIKKGGEFYKEVFEQSDQLLVNSEFNYEELVDLGANPDKTDIHPVGIDTTRFSYRWTDDHPTRSDGITITTVGRLVEEKGHEYALKAVQKLKQSNPDLDFEYLIVGDGPRADELRKISSDENVDEIVRFLGQRSRGEVIKVLNNSDIFLLPSVTEGFGLVLVEAQAAGLPIVTTSTGGIPQAICKGESALLAPKRNPEALACKLDYLVNNPNEWTEMGDAGREYVMQNYDINVLNDRLIQIYRSILDG